MIKFFKVGNVRIRKEDERVSVSIEEDNVQDSVDYINKHGIKEISVTHDMCSLDFLSECPDIEIVHTGNEYLRDVTGLYQLKNLKSLSLNDIKPSLEIDFGRIPSLEVFWGQLPPKAKGVGALENLKEMRLWSYKPKSKNLEPLSLLKKLKSLELIQSNITSLKGAEGLESLETLGLYYLRSFSSLQDIKYLSGTLKVLDIENCKKIGDFNPIVNLKGLEVLNMRGCGEIQSIKFVSQLPELKMLAFDGSTIIDGQLSPCEGIEQVYFTQKKHYSHKLKEYTAIKKKEAEILLDRQSNEKLPTALWRERMEEGDDLFTEEALAASEKVLQQFVAGLKSLDTPTEQRILEKVKEVVLEFNGLNEDYEYFIETMEREELYDFIDEKARAAGLEPDGDITEEWREW
jgi:hypothetical protein